MGSFTEEIINQFALKFCIRGYVAVFQVVRMGRVLQVDGTGRTNAGRYEIA